VQAPLSFRNADVEGSTPFRSTSNLVVFGEPDGDGTLVYRKYCGVNFSQPWRHPVFPGATFGWEM
jgi:hypothetical protein